MRHGLSMFSATSLLVVAMCVQLPLAARADDSAAQTTASSAAPMSDPATAASAPQTLYGSVKKRQNTETAANGLYALAAKKLSQGVQLSAEEYRSLGIGCAGLEATNTFFQKFGKVTDVYPGSPADKAGIRVGDKILAITDDKTAQKEQANPSVPLWDVTLDKEGTQQDVTIIRHGKSVTYNLTRINIEDIQDTTYRQRWEQIVSKLGYPEKGTFSGTSLDSIGQDGAAAPAAAPAAKPATQIPRPTSFKSTAKLLLRMLLPV